ncbi:hypothetical protein [Paludisphaera sp.]|uniref:hypothetical protein n=1 Tax=Paludisphaera sp. TaxID=2017432 RepID=UPI00301E1257
MLKANVGLSRKVSENFGSDGFSVNLEGEIFATPDDPEAVIERIKELFDLADEALSQQVDRHRSDSAIASRDSDHPSGKNGHSNGLPAPEAVGRPSRNGCRDEQPQNGEPATNKQVQFLATLARRRKISGPKLEAFIEEAVGRRSTPYDLTKKEAGAVINALNPGESGDDRARR